MDYTTDTLTRQSCDEYFIHITRIIHSMHNYTNNGFSTRDSSDNSRMDTKIIIMAHNQKN